MLELKNFKSVVKGGQKLSLDQFKSIAIQEKEGMDLEKLTGGILGACHTQYLYDKDCGCYHWWL